ncbi:hypothetical protein [Segetibacter aerophilus]|uniref:Uncharacterized protein n=1 Tax=Segetibacter aerophilus TaxID=670293 RepID=A0A512BCB8_9BACT|nr:hypothetical protein [Segetibacter aerophilus]GEO09564.1 hypothetical protein SAE01_20600 [Segetibacter aerophilus]
MSIQSDPKETNGKPQPATNDPEEVINTPDEVQESNDEKIDQDFPGYPHYPAKDDILNPDNYTERVDIDVENLTRSHTIPSDHIKNIEGTPELEPDFTQVPEEEGEDIEMVPGNEADVTAEDLAMLGDRDQDMDMDEDEQLKARGWQPVTGKDLDVPDADMNGEDALGQGDEENSYYSLGGDRMENLRENDDQNNF